MRDEIRIRFSFGLLAIAAIHAMVLALLTLGLHSRMPEPASPEWTLPTVTHPESVGYPHGGLMTLDVPANVNLQAQGEIKQAGPVSQPLIEQRPCVPCNTQPIVLSDRVISVTELSNTANYSYTSSTSPSPKAYQVALFIDSSSKGKSLLEWFNRDPQLVKLKNASDFQVYTASSAIYQTRFREIVPVDQFPVVLFQDATGGHIHAAGSSMIPATPAELWSDISKSMELYKQAKSGVMRSTGAVKTRGYSWDSEILPTMQLNAEDCDDGYCPTSESNWRPGDRVRDTLFNNVAPARNAFLWANASELATLGVIVVVICLIVFVAIKRGI